MALHLLYGGTFDPVHLGHLAVARAALAATAAARLDFLPAADPPHRPVPGAGFEERSALLELALGSEPPPAAGGWGLDRREGRRPGPSFTVDTLRDWRAEQGESRPLGFVLGADAFLGLPAWKDWRALFDLAHFVVACRPGHDLPVVDCRPGHDLPLPAPAPVPASVSESGAEALPALRAAVAGRWARSPAELAATPAGRVFRLELPARPESATAVREALALGRPAEGLPAAVAAGITARGLYRAAHRGG